MNTYYYISKEGKQEEPINVEDFIKLGLDKSTLVWHKGMPQWTPISDIEKSTPISNTTPPIPNYYEAKKLTDYMPLSVFAAFFFMPAAIIALFYGIRAKVYQKELRYDDAVKANRQARNWSILTFFIAILGWALLIALIYLSVKYDL